MTRFFFHFSSRDQFVADPIGRELAHIGAAHRHALLLIEKAVLLFSHAGYSIDSISKVRIDYPRKSFSATGAEQMVSFESCAVDDRIVGPSKRNE